MARTPKIDVIANEANGSETSAEINLDLSLVPRSERSRVKQDVGEFIIEQTLQSLGDRKSPVSGAPYRSFLTSDEYRKEKRSQNLSPVADLELTGRLKDSLRSKNTREGIKIGHFSASQAPKADGHNNISGDSLLPERRYLPKPGEKYKRQIQTEIDRIIAESAVEANAPTKRQLESISTKTEFWQLMSTLYPDIPRSDVVSAVSRNKNFIDNMRALGILNWLG